MNKKLLEVMKAKCKDMGLSDKAIQEIVSAGSDGLKDDSTDEEIESTANRILPFAKAMQAEGTRWAQQKKQTEEKPEDKGGSNGGQGSKDEEPAWFRKYKEDQEKALKELKAENDTYKAEQAKTRRSADITAKAKELGIPDYLMKRFHIADDADYEKELTEYKQDLVTNKLMPADAAGVKSDSEKAVSEAATDILGDIEVKSEN